MRGIGLVVLAAVLGGCMTVKMVQRDGCWIRQTKKTLHGTQEELGPCTRPAPRWSDDRLTRLVQECVAQADYRWQGHALAAWSRREPLPAQPSKETVIETCLTQTATGVVAQKDAQADALRDRLAEVSTDRDALRAQAVQGDDHLRETSTKLAEYLGEAAKRPPGTATATATATSDGTATTESGLDAQTGSASQTLPAATPLVPVVPACSTPSVGAQPGTTGAPQADACGHRATEAKTTKVARGRKRPRPAARGDCAVPGAQPGTPAGEIAARPPEAGAATKPAAAR